MAINTQAIIEAAKTAKTGTNDYRPALTLWPFGTLMRAESMGCWGALPHARTGEMLYIRSACVPVPQLHFMPRGAIDSVANGKPDGTRAVIIFNPAFRISSLICPCGRRRVQVDKPGFYFRLARNR
jgi:hypothetical protein